jgi:hypothetical protein
VSWYLGQFWLLLLLSFVLGALVGYWWWRRQFRRTQVSSSSSTQGACGHGPLLAEKDAEIKRLRATGVAGSADTADAHAAADVAGGRASDDDGHGLLDRADDAAHDAAAGDTEGETAAADPIDGGLGASVDGDVPARDFAAVSDAADGGSELSADGSHDNAVGEAGVLDDAEATTRVHLAGDGADLVPTVDGGSVDGGSVDGGSLDGGAVVEGTGVAAALAGSGHVDATPDDLERVEGIGPRIAGALKAAGIHTFRSLSDADVATLQSALEAGGLRFAPSLPTWARQARLLADGDEDGFKALTDRLVAGRDTGSNG